jgi:hypothetical protein
MTRLEEARLLPWLSQRQERASEDQVREVWTSPRVQAVLENRDVPSAVSALGDVFMGDPTLLPVWHALTAHHCHPDLVRALLRLDPTQALASAIAGGSTSLRREFLFNVALGRLITCATHVIQCCSNAQSPCQQCADGRAAACVRAATTSALDLLLPLNPAAACGPQARHQLAHVQSLLSSVQGLPGDQSSTAEAVRDHSSIAGVAGPRAHEAAAAAEDCLLKVVCVIEQSLQNTWRPSLSALLHNIPKYVQTRTFLTLCTMVAWASRRRRALRREDDGSGEDSPDVRAVGQLARWGDTPPVTPPPDEALARLLAAEVIRCALYRR